MKHLHIVTHKMVFGVDYSSNEYSSTLNYELPEVSRNCSLLLLSFFPERGFLLSLVVQRPG